MRSDANFVVITDDAELMAALFSTFALNNKIVKQFVMVSG